jgi:tetratricopeptide (TPR) repeat protein
MKRLLLTLGVALPLMACTVSAPSEPPKSATEVPVTSKSTEAIDHFKKGRDFSDNLRAAEAVQEFDQAIKSDPDFALAIAYRGAATPGPDGLKDLEEASAKASGASKPEQLQIAAMLASRRGEFAKGEDAWKQLTDAVPGDWRAHMGRGIQLFSAQKYDEAIQSLTKATELNPNAGPAYNMIGYSHLFQGDAGPAVEALKKYASVAPNEPNALDSVAEALMANGQFAEAEAEFQKALAASPRFDVAWQGIAYTRFFARDWAGGQAAIAKAREVAARPVDRTSADVLGAFGTLAEGKTADGLKQLDVLAKAEGASPTTAAGVPADRAIVFLETGRYREALAEAATALKSADSGTLPPFPSNNLRLSALGVTASAQARMGNAAGLEQTVAAIQKVADARPDDPNARSLVHFAQGALAASQKDMKAADMHFGLCSQQDFRCHWQAVQIDRKVGNKAGADAALARLTKRYVRDPVYLYARTLVTRAEGKQTN